jgi:hypothetical protein
MKRIDIFIWLAFFILCYHSAICKDKKEEVSKTISEKYTTDKDTKLDIKNRYGKVHINTWTKNEITVDITMKAFGKNKEKAQEILDRIKINYAKTGNNIAYETEILQEKSSWWGNWDSWFDSEDKGFEINYVVSMPIENALRLENKYGAVYIDNFNGALDLEVKYGSLKANKMSGVRKNIQISYGKGEIEYIEAGKLEFRYSSGRVEEVGEITLLNKYGSFKINKAQKIDTQTQYGSLSVQSIDELTGEIAYSGCDIGELRKKLVIEVRYASGFQVDKVAAGFEKIDIDGAYNSIKLGFDPKAAFDFKVDTRYGSFKSGLSNTNFSIQRENNNNDYYEGTVNSKGGNVTIKISYGSVKFLQ